MNLRSPANDRRSCISIVTRFKLFLVLPRFNSPPFFFFFFFYQLVSRTQCTLISLVFRNNLGIFHCPNHHRQIFYSFNYTFIFTSSLSFSNYATVYIYFYHRHPSSIKKFFFFFFYFFYQLVSYPIYTYFPIFRNNLGIFHCPNHHRQNFILSITHLFSPLSSFLSFSNYVTVYIYFYRRHLSSIKKFFFFFFFFYQLVSTYIYFPRIP